MEKLEQIIELVDGWVWGIPLIVIILAVGLLLTFRTKLVQVFHLGKAMKFMFKDEEDGVGEVSNFGSLCIALSATIGTGNIVGVATAITVGGPGALFWMIVAAFLGMATKYAEGLLAVKYRKIDADGHIIGGPFYYIENGMGKGFKWLAKIFAIFGIGAAILGIGTITQINGITSAVEDFVASVGLKSNVAFNMFDTDFTWTTIIAGLLVALFAALVIIGGVKRISKVSEVIVPFMAIAYILFCLVLVFCNITKLPAAVVAIVKGAFNPSAVTGGIVGSVFVAMQKGISRGIFSNESGLGSAPIASAAAKTKEPVRQGLVSMTGTFFDTIVICAMTGLAVVMTGAWNPSVTGANLEGVSVTSYAFDKGIFFLPKSVTSFLLMVCLAFFAFTTILGWNFYSERCVEYLVGNKKVPLFIYRILYIVAILVGPYITVSAVWNLADIFNGMMAFPNLIALFALSGVVAKETKDYFARNKK